MVAENMGEGSEQFVTVVPYPFKGFCKGFYRDFRV